MKSFTTKSGHEVFLDDEDYQHLIVDCEYKYCVGKKKNGKIERACRNIPALLSNTGKRKTQCIHWDVVEHPNTGMVIDHDDGNPLNNQKNNLRHCSVQENNQNKRYLGAKNYSSKYPGVCWNKNAGKWQSYITINRKRKHFGYFINEKDAAQTYVNACEKFYLKRNERK